MGVIAFLATVARLFIATSTAAHGLPVLQTTVSAHGARLMSICPMGAASTFTVTTSFAAPTIMPALAIVTTIVTAAILTTAMATAGSEYHPPAPGISE